MRKLFLVQVLLLLITAGYSQDYQPGYYYTKDGAKVVGRIQHVYHARFGKGPQNYILFKGDGKGKEKLTTSEVSAFVIDKDSFTVLRNFSINELITLNEDFVRVVKTGKINLYVHYTSSLNSPEERVYLLEKGGVIRFFDRPYINDIAQQYFGDDQALAQQIQTTKWRDFDLRRFVEQYNQTH